MKSNLTHFTMKLIKIVELCVAKVFTLHMNFLLQNEIQQVTLRKCLLLQNLQYINTFTLINDTFFIQLTKCSQLFSAWSLKASSQSSQSSEHDEHNNHLHCLEQPCNKNNLQLLKQSSCCFYQRKSGNCYEKMQRTGVYVNKNNTVFFFTRNNTREIFAINSILYLREEQKLYTSLQLHSHDYQQPKQRHGASPQPHREHSQDHLQSLHITHYQPV